MTAIESINFETARQCGFSEQVAARIAALPHATPELIHGHCATAPSLGLAMFRIQNNWMVQPETTPQIAQMALAGFHPTPVPS